jgi:hypothetical protein
MVWLFVNAGKISLVSSTKSLRIDSLVQLIAAGNLVEQ